MCTVMTAFGVEETRGREKEIMKEKIGEWEEEGRKVGKNSNEIKRREEGRVCYN